MKKDKKTYKIIDPIQVMIGVADEVDHMPIGFWIYEDGVHFSSDFTCKDLIISKAILLDLADAIDKKLCKLLN